MQGAILPPLTDEQLSWLNTQLLDNVSDKARYMLNSLPAEDIAYLLESSPPKQRSLLWKLVNSDLEGDVLSELNEDVRRFFLESMNTRELTEILSSQDSDDLADMLQQLPNTITQQVLMHMTARDRKRVEIVLPYPEDTAGGLMNTDTLSVHPSLSIEVVLRYFQESNKLPEPLDHLYILEDGGKLIGILPFSRLLTTAHSCTVQEVMETNYVALSVEISNADVAHIFKRRHLVSAPVVDQHSHLLGRITIDDVVDVISVEADHAILGLTGDEHDTFSGTWLTTKRRAVWLCINLFAALIAANAIGLFQDTIKQTVALAVLMPIVASLGGNAGYQSMASMIRAIAQGHIHSHNMRWLLKRELGVGLINGLVWGSVVGIISWLWFENIIIMWVIVLAMAINVTMAVILGTTFPVLLRHLKIDSTLAGPVLLTTITDVIGFGSFLGLSALFI